MGLLGRPQAREGQFRKSILRAMHGRGHQLAPDADHLDAVLITALIEDQFTAVIGDEGAVEQLVDAHLHGVGRMRWYA